MVLCSKLSKKQSQSLSVESHIGGGRFDEFICILIFLATLMNDVYWYYNAATIMSS